MYDWTNVISMMRARSEAIQKHNGDSQLPWVFEEGLSDQEVARAENEFGFRFPPDLCAFLQTALPIGKHFPNWRNGDKTQLQEWLDLPLQGILFDVERNNIWLPHWGPPPSTLQDALQAYRLLVAQAPRLIPVCQHRFIPDEPHEAGNPVFSVHLTDIIHYGKDLPDYFRREFGEGRWEDMSETIRPIRFWDIDGFQVRWLAESQVVWEKQIGLE